MKTTALVSLVVAAELVVASTAMPSTMPSPRPARQQMTTEPVWLQRLQRWLQAVERHTPGSDDAEARAVATWSRSDLRTLLSDLLALRDLLAREHGAPPSREITYRERRFAVSEVQQLLGLDDDKARLGDINRLLWPAALLHTDIAMMVPSNDRPVTGRSVVILFRDGQPDGYQYPVTAQWEAGRSLLDAIRPDPAHDDAVLLWYKATAAYLLATSSLQNATAQLDRARQLFPADADLLFLNGCVHEAYTAPDLQNAVRSMLLPPGHTVEIGSAHSHLVQAETWFRKALATNPRLTEARVRLGRVLGLLGRHQEAADHLRQAATTIGDSQVLYYAYIFLGDEEQALGRRAAAGWYERAATLYQGAQSPLFALSELASRSGDTAGALQAVERIRALPSDDAERHDPWLQYYWFGGRQAGELLANLRASLPLGVKR